MRHHLHGPLGMLTGFSLFSFIPVLVKVAARSGAGAPVAVLIRFAVGLLCVAAMVTLANQKIRTGNFRVLALRGIIGGFAVMFFFYGVTRTGAGMGTLLNYTHSVWANVLAVLLLRQRPPRSFWPLLAFAATGLYLVINPETTFDKPAVFWGTLAGLLSGFMGGGAILCIKKLRQTDNSLTIFLSFALVGSVVAWLVLAPDLLRGDLGQLKAGFAWPALGALLVMGLFGFGGQMFFTAGYKNTSIQLGTLLSLTTPVLAVVIGSVFLDEPLTLRFVCGAVLILGACLGMSMIEKRRQALVTDA